MWANGREIIFEILISWFTQYRVRHNRGNNSIFFLIFVFTARCIRFLSNVQNSSDQLMNSIWSVDKIGQQHTACILKPFWSKTLKLATGVLKDEIEFKVTVPFVFLKNNFYNSSGENIPINHYYLWNWLFLWRLDWKTTLKNKEIPNG